jgi:hypothetical protein
MLQVAATGIEEEEEEEESTLQSSRMESRVVW